MKPEEIVSELIKKELILVTAESLTGGLIAGTIVNVPGASACFHEGYITYSDEAKERVLGVKKETLHEFGAVSAETVREMAIGALQRSKADLAVAVSGFAGPEGGTAENPVGTVYAACIKKSGEDRGIPDIRRFSFRGDRAFVREQTVAEALRMIFDAI